MLCTFGQFLVGWLVDGWRLSGGSTCSETTHPTTPSHHALLAASPPVSLTGKQSNSEIEHCSDMVRVANGEIKGQEVEGEERGVLGEGAVLRRREGAVLRFRIVQPRLRNVVQPLRRATHFASNRVSNTKYGSTATRIWLCFFPLSVYEQMHYFTNRYFTFIGNSFRKVKYSVKMLA
jgi:hypothetical protein